MWLTGNAGPKNLPLRHHRTTLSGYIFATKAHINNPKKNLLNSNVSPTRPHNMVNFGPLATQICWRVWGTPANFNGFCVLAALFIARHLSSGRQAKFAALNTGRHLHSAGRPSRWALAHILVGYGNGRKINVNIQLSVAHHDWLINKNVQEIVFSYK